MKFKLVLSFIAIIILSGCSSLTPNQRFPDFDQKIKQVKTVDVIIDATVLTDIEGDNVGFNLKKNENIRNQIKTTVETQLTQKGIKANVLFASSGLFIEQTDNTKSKVVLSEDWKETGVDFTNPVTSNSNSVWMTERGKAFIHKVSERGILENKSKKRTSKSTKLPKIEATDLPEPAKALTSDLLAIVRYNAKEVSTGKSIGTGIATGILTAVLTGGMYVGVSMPVSSFNADFTLFDTKNLEVVWNNHTILKGGEFNIEDSESHISTLLNPLPSTVSETAQDTQLSTR